MQKIDGAYGEGGGQIIRSAISFSALTGIPVKLTNIRANRRNPGLAHQHITSVKAVAELSNAEYTSLRLGNSTLEFTPGRAKGGKFFFDIGTAGSITLVLQACLPVVLFSDEVEDVEIRIRGGTDVNWSPPFDYFKFVFLKNLERLGIKTQLILISRGYYPKGGGEAVLKIDLPGQNIDSNYRKLSFADRGKFIGITGIIHNRSLPSHIPHRIQQAAVKHLKEYPEIKISMDDQASGLSPSQSPGTGIALAAEFERSTLGSSALGAKGLPAEKVGTDAASALKTELAGTGAVDIYAADQLIPYLAILGGELTVRELSLHTKTNIWLAEQFFDKKLQVEEHDEFYKISI
ncbi:RNA 3'-terminal phosphate cyclase [[Eubacterium] cellulosolvens]